MNLEPTNALTDALLDLYSFRLRIVGRKHLTEEQIWREWIRSE